MGGNAFPEFNTIRLNKSDYDLMVTKCINLLFQQFTYPQNKFIVIESYRNKNSFGDLDILWCGDAISPDDICDVLGAICYKQNKSVVSYAMPINDDIFQVDLINVAEKHLMSAYSYFAFNDLGNLLGRIFHRAGFKLGHKGMLYVVREPDNFSHVLQEIEVTTSWKEALEFAGYDYNVWLEGFDDLEDVFKYAVSIPLANRTIFRLDETNHQARVRDRKRKTYQEFLKWVNDPNNGVPENEEIEKSVLREQWLQRAFNVFPKFRMHYNELVDETRKVRLAQSKFNGTVVGEITGLSGIDLGIFMTNFINNLNKPKVEWALETSEEDIQQAILSWREHNV